MQHISSRVMAGIIIILMAACSGGGGGSGSGSGGSSPTAQAVNFSGIGAIPGLSANITISGVGTFPMTVNPDNTVSVTIPAPGIPAGLNSMDVTYSANGIDLAQISKMVPVVAGQNITVTFTSSELYLNYDDDSDGWVNYSEVTMGTDPLLASSYPVSEKPFNTISAFSGTTLTASYTIHDTAGEPVETADGTSFNYTVQGGFKSYP